MAHIPYGYRIERGRAVIVPEEAEKIRNFISLYLDGYSVRTAGEEAGIGLSPSALTKLLRSELYLGTDYYPAILSRETYDSVQEARESRTHEGQSRPSPITPVKRLFRMKAPDNGDAGWMSAEDTAAYLYSLITPDPKGSATMAREETAAVNAWRESIGG